MVLALVPVKPQMSKFWMPHFKEHREKSERVYRKKTRTSGLKKWQMKKCWKNVVYLFMKGEEWKRTVFVKINMPQGGGQELISLICSKGDLH